MSVSRDHIISEIKRTAEANGGKALGVQRFEAETGIKESDWRGRYWARWGDGIEEAGYARNDLQRAYPEEDLLKHLVGLIRELGKFPTTAEFRIKARNDKVFPSQTVFAARWGSKCEQIGRVLEYCAGQADYADIEKICAPLLNEAEASDEIAAADESVEFGFVYLMKAGKFYKIGRSNALGRREYELSIQLPEKPKLIHSIKTDDPAGIEAYWHQRFKDCRKNGEWFELDRDQVAAFRRRKFM